MRPAQDSIDRKERDAHVTKGPDRDSTDEVRYRPFDLPRQRAECRRRSRADVSIRLPQRMRKRDMLPERVYVWRHVRGRVLWPTDSRRRDFFWR